MTDKNRVNFSQMQIEQTSDGSVLGIISDTHGPVTDEAAAAIQGVDRILFAGDIGSDSVLRTLEAIAPVTAVRGNMDCCGAFATLPWTALVEVAEVSIYIIHDLQKLDLDPRAAGIRVVVHGHTHCASLEMRQDVLYINPGSAAFPRGPMSSSIARVSVVNGRVFPEIVPLRPVKDIPFARNR